MILPPPWAMKCLPAAWLMKKADLMLTFITSSQSFSLKSTASARRIRPALLTRMSSRPRPSMVSATTRATGSTLIRLASMLTKRRPSARTFSAVSSAGTMPAPAISAPAAASATAIPWPSPVLAPVTKATLPSRLNGFVMVFFSPNGVRGLGRRPWSTVLVVDAAVCARDGLGFRHEAAEFHYAYFGNRCHFSGEGRSFGCSESGKPVRMNRPDQG